MLRAFDIMLHYGVMARCSEAKADDWMPGDTRYGISSSNPVMISWSKEGRICSVDWVGNCRSRELLIRDLNGREIIEE